jgi:hypothetical protein
MVNRRNFLKAITAFVGAAAVPVALVEACQIDAPIPKDWTVGLLDIDGNVFSRVAVESLEGSIIFPESRNSGTVTSFFVEGKGISGRVTGAFLRSMYISPGITVSIGGITISEE